MVFISIKTLILSISAAAMVTAAVAGSTSGGCADLASKKGTNITYVDVKNCYDSIPFNKAIARSTLETVTTLFDQYYISRDWATAPHLPKPFESDPVDIVAKLKKIGRTSYTSDRKFHTDIYEAIESLHDGHAAYGPYCYSAYLFGQPLNLYAPVINGKQVLQVYKDNLDRGYEDCDVIKIDGRNAMAEIKKRANVLMTSKDPNVRFNEALASMAYSQEAGTFVTIPGQFANRQSLPERPSVHYELRCPKSKRTILVDDAWVISPQGPWQFTDTDSYYKSVCLAPSSPAASSVAKRDLDAVPFRRHDEVVSKRALEEPAKDLPPPILAPAYPLATRIGVGNSTVFYQLKDHPTVGVVVIYVMAIDFAEIDFMYQSLDTLYESGVTDIIIDVVGGNGGYANVGPDIAQLFFPNKGPLDKAASMNFRVTPAIQKLSAKVFNSTDGGMSQVGNMFSVDGGGFYDASRFFDFGKNHMYSDNSLFLNTVTESHHGRKAVYTKMTSYQPHTHPTHPNVAKYPWTNNPDRLRIVTDGRCVSACANAIYFLANQYKVKSYGIGGNPGQPLSKYAYAAGAAIYIEKFQAMFAFANVTSPVKDLPYQAILGWTVAEIFAPGSKLPLEFDAARHPTDYRLNYDPVNARSREAMWSQVATAAWKK
ncbi:hypothetical protein EMPS_01509 [Entomortierella parvispora]|uniref:Tail specific protease domain-containing protein n=1 Tax=Entomortierella parvispora TaxID=205924 RepID=A0A9P3H3P3_9FUNG|nr:hypothetical protein EMPS_01509 [Entomortierella parvispora]